MRAIIGEAEYRKQLATVAGKAFLFFGEEDYLKAYAVAKTREALSPDPSFAVFNDVGFDALDFTPEKLVDAMMPPPMMASARLILVQGLDLTRMKAGEVDALLSALSLLEDYDYNTVILSVAAGMIDEGYLPKRPSAILKKLGEVMTPVRFEASSEARLSTWAEKHFAHHGVSAPREVTAFLVSFSGRDMYILSNEIEKIAYFVRAAGRTVATVEDVRTVASPFVGSDAFALSNAILAGKPSDALDALAVLKFERAEPTFVMGELSRILSDMQAARVLLDEGKNQKEIADFLKLHEYKAGLIVRAVSRTPIERLSRAVALAARADAELKRGGGDYAAIEKLICSL